ncbi:TetR/AcrR family transcriptional regulator [Agrilactobacillus composti]|nr:TetR/AcrR family transcriptional regulator [Agrilactobacillus composti]
MTTKAEAFQQTDQLIRQTFIELGASKPISKITISDITRQLGMNRGTFYLHYIDKAALITAIETDFMTQLTEILDKEIGETMHIENYYAGFPYPMLTEIFELIDQQRALLKLLVGPNGDPYFIIGVRELLLKSLLQQVAHLKGQAGFRGDLPDNYVGEIIVSGILDIVMIWLNEAKPISKAAVIDIMMKTRFLSPYQLLGLPDNKKTSD